MLRPTFMRPQHKCHKPQNDQILERLQLAWQDTIKEYIETTRLSGMWLLRERYTQGMARWIWTGILFKLFALSVYLMILQWLSFYSYPIIYSISEVISINDIPFPAVTICSFADYLTFRRDEFMKTLKIPSQYNVSEVLEGFEYFNGFTNKDWQMPKNGNYKALDDVLIYNNITLKQASGLINTSCRDLVINCYWAKKRFECNQHHKYLYFHVTWSFMGPCCSFNYHPNNRSYLPFASNVFGMDGGLTVVGKHVPGRHPSSGVTLYIHHPEDLLTSTLSGIALKINAVNYVELEPTAHLASPEVLDLPPNKRYCLSNSDYGDFHYRRTICIQHCRSRIIHKMCGCIAYHSSALLKETLSMEEIPECKLKDLECYMEAKEKLNTIQCNECMPSCYDTTYDVGSFSVLSAPNLPTYNAVFIQKGNQSVENYFMANVYMKSQSVSTLSRVTTMSWISLLSNLGGIFNLCMGLSVISLIEVIYYITYRFYVHYRAHCVLLVKPKNKK